MPTRVNGRQWSIYLRFCAEWSLEAPGGNNLIATINDLEITGTGADGTYDVMFHHGLTYGELYAPGSPEDPITFQTATDAETVLLAIQLAVNDSDLVVTGTKRHALSSPTRSRQP